MPQGSLFNQSELHRVEIVLQLDELEGHTKCQIVGRNRASAILASASVTLEGFDVAELLPVLLAEVGYGYLYRGAHEAVTLPIRAFKARRKDLLAAKDG